MNFDEEHIQQQKQLPVTVADLTKGCWRGSAINTHFDVGRVAVGFVVECEEHYVQGDQSTAEQEQHQADAGFHHRTRVTSGVRVSPRMVITRCRQVLSGRLRCVSSTLLPPGRRKNVAAVLQKHFDHCCCCCCALVRLARATVRGRGLRCSPVTRLHSRQRRRKPPSEPRVKTTPPSTTTRTDLYAVLYRPERSCILAAAACFMRTRDQCVRDKRRCCARTHQPLACTLSDRGWRPRDPTGITTRMSLHRYPARAIVVFPQYYYCCYTLCVSCVSHSTF